MTLISPEVIRLSRLGLLLHYCTAEEGDKDVDMGYLNSV